MDWTAIAMFVLSAVVVPTGGWMIRATIKNSNRFDTHEATDVIHFKNIAERLTELQNGQKDQTAKIDKLIDRFL